MSGGIVYILTNPCLDGWVKIGMSDRNDVDKRLAELNSPSNLPLSFRVYAIYHVETPKNVERAVHDLIDHFASHKRAKELLPNGKYREREFFQMSPDEALKIFRSVATARGDIDSIELVAPSETEQKEEEVALKRARKITFEELKINPGATLVFAPYESEECVVEGGTTVKYEGGDYTLSGLALKLHQKHKMGNSSSYQGGLYFKVKGESETLVEKRKRLGL